MAADLDELDYRILHSLQQDARNQTPVDMAALLPVSDTTIRNRIEKLEDQGVIESYVPIINYERAGFPIRMQFYCTTSCSERADVVEDILAIPHVVAVDELLCAHENLSVLAVATTTEEIEALATRLEALPLTIEREQLLRRTHVHPMNHLGEHAPPLDSSSR